MILVTCKIPDVLEDDQNYFDYAERRKIIQRQVRQALPYDLALAAPVGAWDYDGYVWAYGKAMPWHGDIKFIICRATALEHENRGLLSTNYVGFKGRLRRMRDFWRIYKVNSELDKLYIDLVGSPHAHIQLWELGVLQILRARFDALHEIISLQELHAQIDLGNI